MSSKKTTPTKKVARGHYDLRVLNEVTATSKILSAVLFILLPLIAFYLGLAYQNTFDFEFRNSYMLISLSV